MGIWNMGIWEYEINFFISKILYYSFTNYIFCI